MRKIIDTWLTINLTKNVSNIALGHDYMTSVNLTLNDNLININEGDISNEKGEIINNSTSIKEDLETNKQARYNSRYLHNRNYHTIVRENASAEINMTDIVHNAKKDRIIPMTNIEMATSKKCHDNKAMIYIVDLHLKEHTYTVKGGSMDTVSNHSEVAAFINSDYEIMIMTEGDKESDEENEEYIVEADVVVGKRGIKNNSNITSLTKRIGKYETKTDIIQEKINEKKKIKETTINNGNVWKKDGQRNICERKKGSTKEKGSTHSIK